MADAKKAVKKKKVKKNIPVGVANIYASFNNTIVSICDMSGNVVSWSSSGCAGFKGSRKSTPFAAQLAGEMAGRRARDCGMRQVSVLISGAGSGRESALRALSSVGLSVSLIRDVTPMAHNGVRARKARRV